MMFEEVILLTFLLAKLKKKKSWEDADHLLTRLSIGRKTRKEKVVPSEKLPYNIVTALDEGEKYLKDKDTKMAGILNDTYTNISDYVHPNAPSRYYFWTPDKNKIKFEYRKKVNQEDLGFVLNYGCMTLELFLFIYPELNNLKLPK